MPTLQSIGVHPQLQERLMELEPAIETPQALLSRDPSSLAQALQVPLVQIQKVRASVANALVAETSHGRYALRVTEESKNDSCPPIVTGAMTALDYWRSRMPLEGKSIATDSCQLNGLLAVPPLGNGLAMGYVTQVTGPPASGKTQLALAMAARHAAASGKVHYLASGFGHGTLLPLVRRLQHFCTEANFQQVLQNITFVTVSNGYQALAALQQVTDEGALLVFDSASGCLSADLYASGDGGAGVNLALQVGYTLKQFARQRGMAVLVTNGTVTGDGNAPKAALGQTWHVADISLWFQPVQDEFQDSRHLLSVHPRKIVCATLEHHVSRSCHDPSTLRDRIVEFAITSSGIVDVVNNAGKNQVSQSQ